jgi:uncharacterized protein YbjT (DUF2867 family)
MRTTVLLAGATGLVGRACLKRLLDEPTVGRVITLVRRWSADDAVTLLNTHKLDVRVIDFEHLRENASFEGVDAVVSALGTTVRRAGSQDRFRRVDFEYPLTLARLGLARSVKHFLLVSAVGASSTSRFFYNRIKGQLEDALLALPYRSITIVRPSTLLGERAEFRFGEEMVKRFAWALPEKYRPVHAWDVSATLVQAVIDDRPGTRIIESREIRPGGFSRERASR